MSCITLPRLPPVHTLVHSGRAVLKNRIMPALSAPGKRIRRKPTGHARTRRYTLCSPRLCAALQRVLPTYGLIQTTTPDGTWFRIDSLTIRLTDSVVSLYAGTKTAVHLGLLTLIAAADTVLPDDSLIVPEHGDQMKKCLDYLTNQLCLPFTAALAFLIIIPEQADHPENGVSLSDLAPALLNPDRFRADCTALVTHKLISITDDQITLTSKGTRTAHYLINRWYRRA